MSKTEKNLNLAGIIFILAGFVFLVVEVIGYRIEWRGTVQIIGAVGSAVCFLTSVFMGLIESVILKRGQSKND